VKTADIKIDSTTPYFADCAFKQFGKVVVIGQARTRRDRPAVRVRTVAPMKKRWRDDITIEAGTEFVIPSRNVVREWTEDDESERLALEKRRVIAGQITSALEKRGLEGISVKADIDVVAMSLAEAAFLLAVPTDGGGET
jgi:hypothetical protein